MTQGTTRGPDGSHCTEPHLVSFRLGGVRKRGDTKKAVEEVLRSAALEGEASSTGGPAGTMQVAEIRAAIEREYGWLPLPAAVTQALKRGSTGYSNPVFEKVDKAGNPITGRRNGYWRYILSH